MIRRQDFVDEARKWIGTPFRDKGRTKAGIDCVGLAFVTVWAFDLNIDDVKGYPSRPNNTFKGYFDDRLPSKPVAEALDGDLYLFADGGHLCHCGIASTRYGQPAVVHATLRYRTTLEQSLEEIRSVMGRPLFCYSIPGVG
jgi:cell wall-associated NlpC family hydrolase